MNDQRDLLNLYERKKDVVSRMDGFQIARKIEDAAFEVLTEIFSPYTIGRLRDTGFGYMPDCEVRFEALEKEKNRVFFEIKSGDLLGFELREIEKMIRELRVTYRGEFYSLVVIARSFRDRVEIKKLCDRAKPEKIAFISAETLTSILDLLKREQCLRNEELKNIFLASLFEQTGILSYETTLEKMLNATRKKAGRLDTQLKSALKLLESAKMTLNYWAEQSRRWKSKQEFIKIRHDLERELLWSRVNADRLALEEWRELVSGIEKIRSELHADLEKIGVKEYAQKDIREFLRSARSYYEELGRIQSKIEPKFEERRASLEIAANEASKSGPEVAVTRPFAELTKEIALIDGHLASLTDVNEDVGRMYDSYSGLLSELRKKEREMEREKSNLQKLADVLSRVTS